jgi:hypothetical protein
MGYRRRRWQWTTSEHIIRRRRRTDDRHVLVRKLTQNKNFSNAEVVQVGTFFTRERIAIYSIGFKIPHCLFRGYSSSFTEPLLSGQKSCIFRSLGLKRADLNKPNAFQSASTQYAVLPLTFVRHLPHALPLPLPSLIQRVCLQRRPCFKTMRKSLAPKTSWLLRRNVANKIFLLVLHHFSLFHVKF